MGSLRNSSLLAIGLLLSAQIAFAQTGGGVDGGGGGGVLAPGRDSGTTKLTALFTQGIEFLTEGDCKRAEKKFEEVLKKVPRNSEANYLRGIALQCQGKHQAAVRYFRRAKRDDAQFYQAYEALGISYLNLDRTDLAAGALDELSRFKELCEIGNRICPETLLKSHRKLATAYARVEGAAPDPSRDKSK